MISDRLIINCINDSHSIAGAGFAVSDPDGRIIAEAGSVDGEQITVDIKDGDDTVLILTAGKDAGEVAVQLVASQLRNLITACADRVDRNSFFRDLLLGSMLPVEV